MEYYEYRKCKRALKVARGKDDKAKRIKIGAKRWDKSCRSVVYENKKRKENLNRWLEELNEYEEGEQL